jgi:hypothetical protein
MHICTEWQQKTAFGFAKSGFCFVGWARFFARHDAFNVALFGVQNSVHTLPG